MIWEQRVEVIAMLTKLEEGKVLKAHRYWPTKGTKEYGDITVTLVSNKSKHNDSYRVKVFTVQRVRIYEGSRQQWMWIISFLIQFCWIYGTKYIILSMLMVME